MTFNQLVLLQRPRFPPPSWAEIVDSVCALDGAKRPLFTLEPEDSSLNGCLTVQGRPGAYTLTAYFPGCGYFRFHDPHRDNSEVEIYRHDLLWDFVEERYVSEDLIQVLGVVRYFWEYGELHPSVNWEKL